MPARPIDVLEYELQGEKAASLGRVARKMEAACARLRELDAHSPERDALVAEAAEYVWFYVVQREAMGWRDHGEALAIYQVPPELIARMGPRRR
jgi:hypothetical protein